MTHEEWLKEAERLADQHGRFRWETGCAEQVGHTKTAVNLDEKAVAARAALMAHLALVQQPTIPESAILARMKYHFRPADEDCDEDDFDLYDADIDCAVCVPVLIVRADAVAAARQTLAPAGVMTRCRPCPSNSLRGFSPGLALRQWLSVREFVGIVLRSCQRAYSPAYRCAVWNGS